MSQPPYFFECDVQWIIRKRASLTSPGLPRLEVSSPPEFNGDECTWTPEHLFVSAVNSCFVMTFLAIAGASNLEVSGISSQARARLAKPEDGSGLQITDITLRPRIMLGHTRDLDRAARIVEKAERNCLISRSIKSVVRLEPEIYSAGTTAG
jgi:organic hydroperoxide reductase OsmC/OhrA